MRNVVAPLLGTVVALSIALAGCSVKVQAGSEPKAEPKKEAAPPPPPPEKKEKPKAKINLRKFKKIGNQVEIPGPVLFETGSDKLLPESDPILEIVESYMKQEKQVDVLRIEGHTDSDGADADNQTLSEKRAMAVSKWLVAKGIDCKRVLPVGFGESKPIADNNTPDGKMKNRRVAFFDAVVDGKPVEKGKPVDAGGKTAGDPCAK